MASVFGSSYADDDQINADEEYARLLAAREGYGVGGLGPDDIRQMEDGDGIFRPDSHSMRENVMVRVNILRGASPAHNRRIMTLLTLLWNVPKLAAISVVLSLYWPSSCDSPLGSWALVEGIRILFALIITLSVYYGVLDEDGNQRNSPVRWLLLKCYSSLRSLHFVWYAVGVYWVLSSTTCSSDAVAIYHLCLALIVVDTIDFMKNFLALVCLLPVALLCLPCVIRLISILDDPDESRGATEAEIADLPSFKYEKNLFNEEEPQCVICRCEYDEGDELRVLGCNKNHHFHAECIDEWLKVRDNCPYCRSPVIGDGDNATDSANIHTGANENGSGNNNDEHIHGNGNGNLITNDNEHDSVAIDIDTFGDVNQAVDSIAAAIGGDNPSKDDSNSIHNSENNNEDVNDVENGNGNNDGDGSDNVVNSVDDSENVLRQRSSNNGNVENGRNDNGVGIGHL